MDVNSPYWSQQNFIRISKNCPLKNGLMCKTTKFICKDYMCKKVKESTTIQDLENKFRSKK